MSPNNRSEEPIGGEEQFDSSVPEYTQPEKTGERKQDENLPSSSDKAKPGIDRDTFLEITRREKARREYRSLTGEDGSTHEDGEPTQDVNRTQGDVDVPNSSVSSEDDMPTYEEEGEQEDIYTLTANIVRDIRYDIENMQLGELPATLENIEILHRTLKTAFSNCLYPTREVIDETKLLFRRVQSFETTSKKKDYGGWLQTTLVLLDQYINGKFSQ